MSEEKKFACFVCGGIKFHQEKGQLDSKWGVTGHNVNMIICKGCGYVHLFTKGRTYFFNFD